MINGGNVWPSVNTSPPALDSSEIPLLARTVQEWTVMGRSNKRAEPQVPKQQDVGLFWMEFLGWDDVVYVCICIHGGHCSYSPHFLGCTPDRAWHSSSAWLQTRIASVAELIPSWDAPRRNRPNDFCPDERWAVHWVWFPPHKSCRTSVCHADAGNFPFARAPYFLPACPEVKVEALKRNQAATMT